MLPSTSLEGHWRLSAGARWEDWKQLSLPVDPLQFDPRIGKIEIAPEALGSIGKAQDDYYPAVALTWMRKDFQAEDFQLRFGWSRTTARPDLREVTDSTYIDPFTEARVIGNPGLAPSDLTNYDLRAEWFFANGDNFTVSPFYKQIERPIETVEGAGTDNNLSFTFVNGESADLYGVEVEWLKDLGFASRWLGAWAAGLFTAGNITWSDSELTIGSATLSLTNDVRPLNQQSDLIANLQPATTHRAVRTAPSSSTTATASGCSTRAAMARRMRTSGRSTRSTSSTPGTRPSAGACGCACRTCSTRKWRSTRAA